MFLRDRHVLIGISSSLLLIGGLFTGLADSLASQEAASQCKAASK
jgi:hypothetical protein